VHSDFVLRVSHEDLRKSLEKHPNVICWIDMKLKYLSCSRYVAHDIRYSFIGCEKADSRDGAEWEISDERKRWKHANKSREKVSGYTRVCHAIFFAGAFYIDEIHDAIAPPKKNTNNASVPYFRPLPSPFFVPSSRLTCSLYATQFRASGRDLSCPFGSFSFPAEGKGNEVFLTSSRKWHGYNSVAVGARRITSAISKDIFKHFFPPILAVRWSSLGPLGGRRSSHPPSPGEIPLAFYCLAFTPSFLLTPNLRTRRYTLPAYFFLVLVPDPLGLKSRNRPAISRPVFFI